MDNILEKYFPKTWKFISQKGSIKNFYKFEYNLNETNLINSKLDNNKIDFFDTEYKTSLSYHKTPFTFHGFSTDNIINDDLKYLNVLEKLKNTLFLIKIKIYKNNDKIKIDINNTNFRIPIFARPEFIDTLNSNFELRFAYYLKLLIDYEYLTYEIIYKDAIFSVPYWSMVSLPVSYLTMGDSKFGIIFRTVITTLIICVTVLALISLFIHKSQTVNKLKNFGYFEKYNEVKEIIREDDLTISQNVNKIRNDLKFIKSYLQTPLTESSNLILLEENFIFDKLEEITSTLDEVISNNINTFIPHLT